MSKFITERNHIQGTYSDAYLKACAILNGPLRHQADAEAAYRGYVDHVYESANAELFSDVRAYELVTAGNLHSAQAHVTRAVAGIARNSGAQITPATRQEIVGKLMTDLLAEWGQDIQLAA